MREALLANDDRWQCRTLVELSSASVDPDRYGIGGSPYVGDAAATGVRIPDDPTTELDNRYLARLCGFQIPGGRAALIHAIRQYATIGQVETIEPEGQMHAVELPVTTPTWCFRDGNISWHLMVQGVQSTVNNPDPNGQPPGASPSFYDLDSSLLYTPPFIPYVAPNAGIPVGDGLDGLQTWRDMRFPWGSGEWNQHLLVKGPGVVVFYASVRQTDPLTRAVLAVADPGAMCPEDRFIATFQSAIYRRVAGALLVETIPCCPEGQLP